MTIRLRPLLGLIVAGASLCGWAQTRAPRALESREGPTAARYIFAGTVIGIERVEATKPGQVATVRVSFRVDDAVRGVRQGQTLSVREWAGLWESGGSYRMGERVFLFLYAPSRVGLTSPVGGWAGRYAINSAGQIRVNGGGVADAKSDPALPQELRGRKTIGSRDLARALRRSESE